MKLKHLLTEALNKVSSQEARDRNFFGPVWHGSTPEKQAIIKVRGFQIFKDEEEGKRHGYPDQEYGKTGYPPPIDHLGFGVYFTTSKSIAKHFNGDSLRGLVPFYLDAPNILEINFAAQNTMMKWWMDNGYNPGQTYPRQRPAWAPESGVG